MSTYSFSENRRRAEARQQKKNNRTFSIHGNTSSLKLWCSIASSDKKLLPAIEAQNNRDLLKQEL
jgi:hypothetical protein